MEHKLTLPLDKNALRGLESGDTALLTGELYTARDAAHKRLVEGMERGEALPFELEGATFYYVGPTPAPPGAPIGSAGPTTSYRMDDYTPALLGRGLAAMIGKGVRGPRVIEAMQQSGAVYFGAIGGAGALLAQRVKASRVVAFEDLGTEAVRRLWVENFPVIVVIDSRGRNLYVEGPQAFLQGRPRPPPLEVDRAAE